ncbi:MAG TPA: DUF2130 domain-containing protein [Cytophagaceae bacterium]|jgi:hypothetical protein
MESKITCPKCNHLFKAEDAMAHEIEERVKHLVAISNKEKAKELQEKEEKLRNLQAKWVRENEELKVKISREKEEQLIKSVKEKEELRRQFENLLVEQKKKTSEEMKLLAREEMELELKSLQEEVESKKQENRALKSRELELMKMEKALKEREEEMHIEQEKRIMEKCGEIEQTLKHKFEETSQVKMKEKDMQLEALKKQVDEMKRRMEQGSTQLQGEAQEIVLEEILKSVFPFDLIEEVGKGVSGADVVHTIRNTVGKECGRIIYESKRTKTFNEAWILKLKNDLRGQKGDLAVIVTECMPKDMNRFGNRDGIWICSFQEVKGVAMILRDSIQKIDEIRCTQENKGDKQQMLYDYLTGNEFRQHVEAILEAFNCMLTDLNKEKQITFKRWSEREKQLQKVMMNTSGLYGSIKGIAGKAVMEIKQLDSPQEYLLESNND